MGEIVGAAWVSHHPGLMLPEDRRRTLGKGEDSDLIAGYGRVREKIDATGADTLVVFDTHWITTNVHTVAGRDHYAGTYTSDEMPNVLSGMAYDYDGAPDIAARIEELAKARGFAAFNATDPNMANHYATLNVLSFLHRGERVLSVGTCQNATLAHYLEMGGMIGEAIAELPGRVVMLASGGMSHRMSVYDIDLPHPNYFHADNVSSADNVRFDQEMLALFAEGRHDAALDRYLEMRKATYEGWGAHYVQMIAALGGRDCRWRGAPLSAYENARGTGNIHIWFEK